MCQVCTASPVAESTRTSLKGRSNTAQLTELTTYMERQWVRNTVFDVPSWCVFRHTIRTNNDVEGWHNRLNKKAVHAGLGFYQLVMLLVKEARVVELNVSADDLERDRSSRFSRVELGLHEAWE
ncbi:uncharacterized protein LOC121371476 [Gigantopelta aegis]|uniref:uncharacterized protein LOC121371476 n=1 Tax=Gigantopelta aegis TaxID=1735272 RepID=UPI001B88DC69|nr:uncharacterized protein LOC121371476 [Gigantopelta aegis]